MFAEQVQEDYEVTPTEAFRAVRETRQILADMLTDLHHVISWMSEDLYYYDRVQADLDDLVRSLRKAHALADELVETITTYIHGGSYGKQE